MCFWGQFAESKYFIVAKTWANLNMSRVLVCFSCNQDFKDIKTLSKICKKVEEKNLYPEKVNNNHNHNKKNNLYPMPERL